MEPNKAQQEKAHKFISSWCDKEISKEKMTADDKKSVMERVSFHDSIQGLNDIDFAVEAASEDFNLKKRIF